MLLQNLTIALKEYGEFKGQHLGEVVFANNLGSVRLNLNATQIEQIFAVCAESILERAQEAATNLTRSVIEHDQQNVKALPNE